jgi:hypothetical protein
MCLKNSGMSDSLNLSQHHGFGMIVDILITICTLANFILAMYNVHFFCKNQRSLDEIKMIQEANFEYHKAQIRSLREFWESPAVKAKVKDPEEKWGNLKSAFSREPPNERSRVS